MHKDSAVVSTKITISRACDVILSHYANFLAANEGQQTIGQRVSYNEWDLRSVKIQLRLLLMP